MFVLVAGGILVNTTTECRERVAERESREPRAESREPRAESRLDNIIIIIYIPLFLNLKKRELGLESKI